MPLTRRTFLQASAATCILSATPLLASVLTPANPIPTQRLDTGWEFYRGPLDPHFQVWHSEEIVSWAPVSLPHCFNAYDACDPDTPAYRGPGWYRTRLSLANPYPNGRTLLHFEAAGQRAEIYLGTQLVGIHSGGYDEFLIDITDFAPNQAQIPLAVLCDNSRDIERMPADISDFTLYGGLYRPVHLVYVPATSIDLLHTRATWQPGGPAHVSIRARFYVPNNTIPTVTLRLTVFNPANQPFFTRTLTHTVTEGESELATLEIPNPDTWSPANPTLYRTELTLLRGAETTTVSHRFGIRHFRFEDHGPFFLNGQRIPIRGTQRHEDHAGYAAAMPDALIVEEMRLIKQMGANFVRLAHYQQSRLVLDQCDELGLLVWEEVPWCRSGVGTELFQQRGRQQLTNMIEQHSNHPSIILWGLGNEDDWPGELNGADHAAIRTYMTTLRDLAYQLDPTRLTSFRRSDFARDIPDVYSPSIWAGWYSGSYTEYRAALENARPTVPHLLHVEFGADSHAGRHAEDPDPVLAHLLKGRGTAEQGLDYKLSGGGLRVSRDGEWSETYACDLFDWYLKTLDELPWLTGAVQWIFKDFTTPLRVENPVPRVNQKGLLTRDMVPKEGYFVFQSYWSPEPMLRLYGHDWPIRWGKQDQERMVRVYSNCAEVELFLNGESVGVRKRDPQDFPAAGLRWNLKFKPGQNVMRAVAHSSGTTLSDQVKFIYQIEAWGQAHHLQLAVEQNSSERIVATLHDEKGVQCLDSRAVVRFSLSGEGQLHDNLGTPSGSRVVQLANGRATISLSHSGDIVAAVQSTGIFPAFLSLSSRRPTNGVAPARNSDSSPMATNF
jgi:beta-galactosidase